MLQCLEVNFYSLRLRKQTDEFISFLRAAAKLVSSELRQVNTHTHTHTMLVVLAGHVTTLETVVPGPVQRRLRERVVECSPRPNHRIVVSCRDGCPPGCVDESSVDASGCRGFRGDIISEFISLPADSLSAAQTGFTVAAAAAAAAEQVTPPKPQSELPKPPTSFTHLQTTDT